MRAYPLQMVILAAVTFGVGCDKSTSTKPHASNADHHAPVSVRNPTPESMLTTVTLSESARSHLAVETVVAHREAVPNDRTYGGEVVIPEGRSIIISAPLSGTIASNASQSFPNPGTAVGAGDVLFELHPSLRSSDEVLNPSDRIALARARADLEAARVSAAGDVESAKVRVEGTRIALDRAEKLVRENAGSVRSLDEARAEHRLAQTAMDAAEARRKVLDETMSYLQGDSGGGALTITAPFAGHVRRLLVAPGEFIAVGAQLCELASFNPLWVRSSVYVGDLPMLSLQSNAEGHALGGAADAVHVLRPIAAPPTANAATSTVDLYYEIVNADSAFQPGERMVVSIPAKGETSALVIPQTSVVYDIHGDAWVYLAKEDDTFVRRRITIRRVTGGNVVVATGLDEGDRVVTQGAAELFGVEFGTAGH
ncbi:MAG: efflux RND transporter periplasmic adaptor subunit [Phycisphaerales bacterium]|nr:efflux RND transporter periplasmic adaptor subunit [Phycisphaerales bacterium]MCB9856210.1 efflux RND transporter periplasmic adaptor subunit [Phycisphaerales bacterium]MCB9863351.1 efflux RND transporter periplasmic adaptor subunit [Phycisphaerales bacterium]